MYTFFLNRADDFRMDISPQMMVKIQI